MSWTADEIDLAKRLWSEGQSASQVAWQVPGKTKNAVIGKMTRLGLTGGDNAPRAYARSARPRIRSEKQRAETKKPPIPDDAPEPVGAEGDFVGRGACQFIHGHPNQGGWRMCGAPAEKTYCPFHHRLTTQPVPVPTGKAFRFK